MQEIDHKTVELNYLFYKNDILIIIRKSSFFPLSIAKVTSTVPPMNNLVLKKYLVIVRVFKVR